MPTVAVSIKERIKRQVAIEADAGTDVDDTRRFDARGTSTAGHADVAIEELSETVEEICCGNPPYQQSVLLLKIGALVVQAENSTVETDRIVSKWQGRVENALMSNRFLTEDTTMVQLAVYSRVVSRDPPDLANGGVNASLTLEVTYQHDGDDVTKYGTAITQVTETETT